MEEVDLSKELQKFYEKNKGNKIVLSKNEIHKKMNKKLFSFNNYYLHKKFYKEYEIIFGLVNGLCFTKDKILQCGKSGLGSSQEFTYDFLPINILSVHPTFEYSINKSEDIHIILLNLKSYEEIFNKINTDLFEITSKFFKLKGEQRKEQERLKEEDKRQKLKEKRERLNEEKKLRDQQKHFKNLERKKVLKEGVIKFINEFDSDKDGIIDFNQGGDDFMNLLKKHQKTIIQVDQNHITKLIQISNYLKTKRGNIQTQFEKIKNSRNSKQLNEFTGILKNQIDTFNLLNYNSLIIIISLVEGDLITFNEIYLTFDKLNIFNSNWENQVSEKLNNIDSKLDEVIYSINKMELSIVNEILGMSIMNQVQMNRLNKNVKEGNMMIDENLNRLNSSLSSNLKSIDSTLKVGNLISTINTYQNYKINKNTKSLRG